MSAHAKRLGELAWSQPPISGAPPTPRSGHSMTVLEDTAVVFGGCGVTTDGQPEVFDETWVLSLRSEPMRWEKLAAEACRTAPSKRWRHTATRLPLSEGGANGGGDSILIFGGKCRNERYNDVHVFHAGRRGSEWSARECVGMPPSPRSHHTASLVSISDDNDDNDDNGYTAENADTDETTSGARPRRSPPHQRLFVIGGFGGAGSRDFLMDVHVLELSTWSWWRAEDVRGPPPSPRSDHCVCVSGEKLVLSGGRTWAAGKRLPS